MKNVISASRRTDIPAFYLDWFIEALRKGWVEVRNPFYPGQSRTVNLTPEHVSWIVFWSRNYAHFLKKRSNFEAYQLFFHFTILPPSVLEKSPMPVKEQLHQLEKLVEFYGPERIIWRYDPLVFWQENDVLRSNHQLKKFSELAKEISALGIQRCYISIAQPYPKFVKRLHEKFPSFKLLEQQHPVALEAVQEMIPVAKKFDIQLFACCNDFLLQFDGIQKGHCIDGNLLNRLHLQDPVSVAKAPSRPQCGCTKSIDIGDYRKQPCYFGCIYCYANPVWK